jgi:hypothetical protein
VKNRATLGEIGNSLKAIYGVFEPRVTF